MTLTAPRPFDFESLLPLLPEDAPTRVRQLREKGIAALQEGRYDEALQAFATLDTLKNFEVASYLSKLGTALTLGRQRKFSEALEVLEEALGLGDDRLVLLGIGMTLLQMERFADALDVLDKVKGKWPDDPAVWAYRMVPLLSLGKAQAALESAEQAFLLRPKSPGRGRLLYQGAACVPIAMGLSALKRRWLPDLEAATKAFIKWRDRARRDKQLPAFKQAVEEARRGLTEEEDMTAFEEFMLGVRLMSIRDPFKAWDALAKEISKDWPKGVSAVQAIREQRRW